MQSAPNFIQGAMSNALKIQADPAGALNTAQKAFAGSGSLALKLTALIDAEEAQAQQHQIALERNVMQGQRDIESARHNLATEGIASDRNELIKKDQFAQNTNLLLKISEAQNETTNSLVDGNPTQTKVYDEEAQANLAALANKVKERLNLPLNNVQSQTAKATQQVTSDSQPGGSSGIWNGTGLYTGTQEDQPVVESNTPQLSTREQAASTIVNEEVPTLSKELQAAEAKAAKYQRYVDDPNGQNKTPSMIAKAEKAKADVEKLRLELNDTPAETKGPQLKAAEGTVFQNWRGKGETVNLSEGTKEVIANVKKHKGTTDYVMSGKEFKVEKPTDKEKKYQDAARKLGLGELSGNDATTIMEKIIIDTPDAVMNVLKYLPQDVAKSVVDKTLVPAILNGGFSDNKKMLTATADLVGQGYTSIKEVTASVKNEGKKVYGDAYADSAKFKMIERGLAYSNKKSPEYKREMTRIDTLVEDTVFNDNVAHFEEAIGHNSDVGVAIGNGTTVDRNKLKTMIKSEYENTGMSPTEEIVSNAKTLFTSNTATSRQLSKDTLKIADEAGLLSGFSPKELASVKEDMFIVDNAEWISKGNDIMRLQKFKGVNSKNIKSSGMPKNMQDGNGPTPAQIAKAKKYYKNKTIGSEVIFGMLKDKAVGEDLAIVMQKGLEASSNNEKSFKFMNENGDTKQMKTSDALSLAYIANYRKYKGASEAGWWEKLMSSFGSSDSEPSAAYKQIKN